MPGTFSEASQSGVGSRTALESIFPEVKALKWIEPLTRNEDIQKDSLCLKLGICLGWKGQ